MSSFSRHADDDFNLTEDITATHDERTEEIVRFWIEAGPKRWFRRDPGFDETIRLRFEAMHMQAACGEMTASPGESRSALARLLLLDQFPRNMYRGTAHAFATDPLARATAEEALDQGLDLQVALELQPFFYLPLEHDENRASQAEAVRRFEAYAERGGDDGFLRYARLHAGLIERFGRFPHRNRVLGRRSTPDESAYLAAGGFKG